jgi:hypothetical protein
MKNAKKTSQKLTHRNFTRGVDEKRKKPQQFISGTHVSHEAAPHRFSSDEVKFEQQKRTHPLDSNCLSCINPVEVSLPHHNSLV